jgi:hypothetical protein
MTEHPEVVGKEKAGLRMRFREVLEKEEEEKTGIQS